MLSAIILTKNEEKNIEACLKCLTFCDELIIIDDFSQDKTLIKIKNFCRLEGKLNFRIYQRKLADDFASQRNFALEKASGDWVLFVDADERVTSSLRKEILTVINSSKNQFKGFYLKRKDKFLGCWLHYGETTKVRLLRLGKRKAGKWVGKVHEVWQIKGKTANLKNPLLHDRKMTIAQFLAKINNYSTVRSEELYKNGEKTNIFLVILYPLLKFIQNYFLRLGFLDGIRGLIMAGMMSLHSFMVRAKLWVRQQNEGREEFEIKDWKKYA